LFGHPTDVITESEYNKRVRDRILAIPASAGPDAHGKNITQREI
jgi:hypothetical protein